MNIIESAKKVAANLRNLSLDLAGTDIDAALLVAEKYGKFLWINHIGIYADSEFEISLAEHFSELLKDLFTRSEGDTLHLITIGSYAGGHTRVVEKFLQAGGGDGLASLNKLPEQVLNQIPEHIKVFNGIRKQTGTATISEILEVGRKFKKLVLHIHPDDVYSAIAAILLSNLGVKVFMYNHADHVFSFGYAAAEKIFEISKYGWTKGALRRIEHKQTFVGIPILKSDLKFDRLEKNNSIRIVMAGNSAKFTPWGKYSVPDFINKFYERINVQGDIKFKICGSYGTENFWLLLDEKNRRNIEFLGLLPHAEYMRVLAAADCYIDTFPQGSGTVLSDSVMLGIPSFGLDLLVGCSYSDTLRVHSVEDLVSGLGDHIGNRQPLHDRVLEVRDKVIYEQSVESCVNRLHASMEEKQTIPFPEELMAMRCMPDFFEQFWLSKGVINLNFELLATSEKLKERLMKCWEDAWPYATHSTIERLVEDIAERDRAIKEANRASNVQLNLLALQKEDQAGYVKEIKELRLSASLNITKPSRDISRLRHRIIQPYQIYKSYRLRHPGLNGVMRLLSRVFQSIRNKGINNLQNALAVQERILKVAYIDPDELAKQFDANRIQNLQCYLDNGQIHKPIIIFDHNGGGGSNTYTKELVKVINADGGMVLRVYYFESVWFVQWLGDGLLFYATSLDELFKYLSLTDSTNLVINSPYGYPDIKAFATYIVNLLHKLNATLDFKVHDFFALCPSPHLSDYEGKYCAVPEDAAICRNCLKRNNHWYHSWYPEINKPKEIKEWHKPFLELLDIASTVTFFDQSSVDIFCKVYKLAPGKIRVLPHDINYFHNNDQVDIGGDLHIGILGTLSPLKGADVVDALYSYIEKQHLQIPLTVVGHIFKKPRLGINVLGKYEPNNLPSILSSHKINIILMPSIVPETFSYTISEAMKMGLPIVSFDIGAQGHRVKQYPLGKVVPLGASPSVILTAILSIFKTAQEVNK
jgi:glycosyltransferase involved in cell wall biosynthesis